MPDLKFQSLNPVTFLDGDAQKEARRSIESYMRTRLSQKPWIAEKSEPTSSIVFSETYLNIPF